MQDEDSSPGANHLLSEKSPPHAREKPVVTKRRKRKARGLFAAEFEPLRDEPEIYQLAAREKHAKGEKPPPIGKARKKKE